FFVVIGVDLKGRLGARQCSERVAIRKRSEGADQDGSVDGKPADSTGRERHPTALASMPQRLQRWLDIRRNPSSSLRGVFSLEEKIGRFNG
ncbi:MAG TPA: hypothetical protein VFT74_18470, partial [Isosphaeraceae bacterium]|nr:hypothetical protein [Isosphaeraceae bacterium]